MRALVIDDNPDDRQLVLHELKALYPEADVVECINLTAFQEAVAAAPPNLVVTDLDLRWSSGRDVLAEVKQLYPNCPVIMFTGTGDEITAVELMKSGLDDYVVKSPRQLPRLRASIRVAVEAAGARSALSQREVQLTAALAHRDLVVRELHHRVKNNLQTIMSLLRLSGRQADGRTRIILEELAGRMDALGRIQARIYETEHLDRVDFRTALGDIASALGTVYADRRLTLRRNDDGPLDLKVDRAMPLGLLCYEVILNSFKHAWPEDRPGLLTVDLKTGAAPVIRLSDDGVGFDVERAGKGFGSRLVRALAAEAGAEVQTVTAPGRGTAVTLKLV